MLEMILGQIWPYLLGALALVAGWVTARQSGKASAKNEQAENERKAIDIAKGIHREVEKYSNNDVDARAARWVRGGKR